MVALVLVLPQRGFADVASPAPQRTPPPQIIRIVTTSFCARLRDHVRPAVAMILQNDQTIAKSPPLFKRYARGAFASQDSASGNFSNGAPSATDSIYNQSPETSLALQQMSYLVNPIAQNVIAAQKLLDDLESKMTGNPNDDRELLRIKSQLLAAIAGQSASLDLINGFVATQQMGELQHAGTEYIASIQGTGTTTAIAHETPNPLQDPNTPGLAPNPYTIDLTAVPGLSVGYNPLSRIIEGLKWVQQETARRENDAATSITSALAVCAK